MSFVPLLLSTVLFQAEGPRAEVGKPVPDFSLEDLRGKKWTLSDFRADDKEGRAGKVVVINFWSCTCPITMEYEERMARLNKEYGDKGVAFVGIDSNFNETREDVVETTKGRGIEHPILLDPDGKVAGQLGARTTPHVFVVDAKGVLRYTGHVDNRKKPGADGRIAYLQDALEALLRGEEVKITKTDPHGCTIKRPRRR
jgi:thiol-disulfide isomerase/thioredoxin